MNRRELLKGLVAAPAIVRSESLMRIWVPPQGIITEWETFAYPFAQERTASGMMLMHQYQQQRYNAMMRKMVEDVQRPLLRYFEELLLQPDQQP